MIRKLRIENFSPFGNLVLDFPKIDEEGLAEVHLITGVNGTGKTRLLALIAALLGEPSHLVRRLGNEKISVAAANTGQGIHPALKGSRSNITPHGGAFHSWASKVPAFAYRGDVYLDDAKVQVLAQVQAPSRSQCLSFHKPKQSSDEFLQAITNLKIQAAMESLDSESGQNSNALLIVKAIERAIQEITERPFSFRVRSHPAPEISVDIGLESPLPVRMLPDGLRSIIGWLAHSAVMLDLLDKNESNPFEAEAVFIFDEIEMHLHPAWQRKILPAFQKMFPKAQMFVATHSPFLISSLNHGWIHSLSLNENGTVVAEKPVKASEGDSYITVLEDIMGLREWYDPETESLLKDFRKRRETAIAGNAKAKSEAISMAEKISGRSAELKLMMEQEIKQLERLASAVVAS